MDDKQQALNKAKINLMSRADSAFFTTVCFSLKFMWDETIPTAATNGTAIKINSKFFMSLNPEERVFLLIHESMHVAYLHMDRLQTRDPAKFNVAADHVINLMLIERGFQMPKVGLADPIYKGMSTEEVYNLLPAQDPSKTDMDIQPSDIPSEELEQAVQDILVRASIQSKMQNDKAGSIPGEIQIFLDKLLDPKLPWNRILQKFLHSMSKNDYTFRKPNRRYFPDHYLPSLYSEKLTNLAIAVDTSGSVSDTDFLRFISEIHCILRMMKPDKITLIQFDTGIKEVSQVRSVQELSKVAFSGRGGTRIEPVLQWANENKPQALLVFTDGHFRFSNEDTKTKTIWLIHDNKKFVAPFGKTIHYSI